MELKQITDFTCVSRESTNPLSFATCRKLFLRSMGLEFMPTRGTQSAALKSGAGKPANATAVRLRATRQLQEKLSAKKSHAKEHQRLLDKASCKVHQQYQHVGTMGRQSDMTRGSKAAVSRSIRSSPFCARASAGKSAGGQRIEYSDDEDSALHVILHVEIWTPFFCNTLHPLRLHCTAWIDDRKFCQSESPETGIPRAHHPVRRAVRRLFGEQGRQIS